MKKIISGLIACSIMATASISAFAKTFPDVTSELSWAKDAIESMSDMGLINGYEDGTFRPDKSVTHQEALALFARAMGSSSDENDEVAKIALDKYSEKLDKYGIYAKEEVAFLLYRGALKESELDMYIGSNVRDKALARYEAAVIITKAMGGEAEATSNLLTDLSYTDAKEIPTNAVQYVYYVTDQNLMKGMGDGTFSPNSEVLRSQMAVMLSNTVNTMNVSFETNKLMEVDTAARNIRVKDSDGTERYISYTTGTVMNVEGVMTQPKDIPAGTDAIFTFANDKLVYVDVLSSIADRVVKGKFTSSSSINGVLRIGVLPLLSDGTYGTEEFFECTKNVSIQYDGSPATIKSFVQGDVMNLELNRGKVDKIAGETKESKITNATVEDIEITGTKVKMTISHASSTYDGMELDVSDTVTVSKNGDTVLLSKVYKGDKVNLTLEYGVVRRIQATSVSRDVEGTIEELVISSTSRLKVRVGGKSVEYTIPSDVKILINDKEGSLYDFRVGDQVKLTIDSEAVVKIVGTSIQTTSRSVIGVVTAINSSLGYLTMDVTENGKTTEHGVFCGDSYAKILSSTGSDKKMKDIAVGQTLTVRGTVKNGAFTATVIIIEVE